MKQLPIQTISYDSMWEYLSTSLAICSQLQYGISENVNDTHPSLVNRLERTAVFCLTFFHLALWVLEAGYEIADYSLGMWWLQFPTSGPLAVHLQSSKLAAQLASASTSYKNWPRGSTQHWNLWQKNCRRSSQAPQSCMWMHMTSLWT